MQLNKPTPTRSKRRLRYPFAQIPLVVIDSLAFANLNGEAVRALNIAARQWNGTNNGLLQLTFSYCLPRGIRSEHTLQRAIASLIEHGFIYRTRSRGTKSGRNICALYALTWQPLTKNKDGLFLDGYVDSAWLKWRPDVTNFPSGKKCSLAPAKSAVSPPVGVAQNTGASPVKNAGYEYLAIYPSKRHINYRPVAPHLLAELTKLSYRPIARQRRGHEQ